ncbi:MAG: tRNA (adenosine(37)-N6)-threonylcarbamoyltransferase complex dimerization subunit type 1 TsaB [Parvibaculum sp.]|uniref:tRNA (adenosine(37)-N6)-threonylcarbamoyltransferase complex dimerization subunit type 1 TsaB n=1 Tax=Parvibaculum sp. TaxID=2024848 RepID=UPI003C744C8C
MPLLALDTAQGALSAAILDGERILAHRFEVRTRGHAEELMPMIEAVLADASLTPGDLTALAVTIGPGTFTGLRVGLAAARGLALARALPLVGVTTLEALAAPVEAEKGEAIAAAFDAKRGEVYLQIFDAAHAPLSEPMIVALDEALGHMPGEAFVAVGTGAALIAERLSTRGVACRFSDAPPQPDALAVARIAVARLAAHGPDRFRIAPAPLYLRAPDAKLPGGLDPVLG